MIRVLVVADSGAAMAAVTDSLWAIAGVEIAGYSSGRAPVAAVVHAVQPDVAVVDQMSWTGLALNRIQEIRAAQPDVAVLGLSDRDADWVIAGLRAGANAVVPRDLQPATLALVLREVTGGASATPEMSAA